MRKLLLLSALFLSTLTASAITMESPTGEQFPIPGMYIKPGDSVDCKTQNGCIIMSVEQLEQLVNGVYSMGQKVARKSTQI